MKPFLLRATLIAALALAPGAARSDTDTDTDAETAAHATVLDLAGAFNNDGFKLRDGDHTGTLKAGQSVVVQVNLYAGNQYWFSVATADPKTNVSIHVYDEAGKPVKADPYINANRDAAGFAPDISGPYYIKVADTGATPATYCLIYSYK